MEKQEKEPSQSAWVNKVNYDDIIKAISINSMVMITDENGTFKDVNHRTCAVSGYSREELVAHTYEDVFGMHPTQQEHITDILRAIERGEIWNGEVKRFTKTGTAYWTYTIVYPFKDETDKVIVLIGISQVITRGKIIAEQFYKQSQAIEDFAFVNSHILRNPLATMLVLCNLVTDSIVDNEIEQVREVVKHIKTTALDLDNAVHQMQAKIQQTRNEKTQIMDKLLNKKHTIKKIMLIDDDELSHLITKRIIQYATNDGIDVMKFKSARQAIAYLMNEINALPDLILLDIEMPKMDGWSFLIEFEKLHTGVPVSILTNSIRNYDQYKAVKYESVQGFWTKPLKVEQVEKLLAVN